MVRLPDRHNLGTQSPNLLSVRQKAARQDTDSAKMPRIEDEPVEASVEFELFGSSVFKGEPGLRGVERPLEASRPSVEVTAAAEESWLQHRLRLPARRRSVQPSRVMRRLKAKQSKQQKWWSSCLLTVALLSAGGTGLMNLFVQEKITLGGVPYGIVRKFWQDSPARDAYFAGDSQALHARLKLLGVEEDIKVFYRDRFPSEYELDRHIHQIMFDRTGYVGEAYEVNKHGRLVSVEYDR